MGKLGEIGASGPDAVDWKGVRAILLRYARCILGPSLESLAEDCVHDLFVHMLEERKSGQGSMKPIPYLKRCLKNRITDVFRDRARCPIEVGDGGNENKLRDEGGEPAPPAGDAAYETIREWIGRLRDTLEHIAWEPPAGSSVDYYAVFLFYTRVLLATRAGRELHAEGRLVHLEVAGWLPWSKAQGSLRFKPGWPSIQELWDLCAGDVNRPPHRLEAAALARHIEEASGGRFSLSVEVWYQWVCRASARAKELAKELVGEKAWEKLLAPLLREQKKE